MILRENINQCHWHGLSVYYFFQLLILMNYCNCWVLFYQALRSLSWGLKWTVSDCLISKLCPTAPWSCSRIPILRFALIFSQRPTGVHPPDISLVNLISVLFVKGILNSGHRNPFFAGPGSWPCVSLSYKELLPIWPCHNLLWVLRLGSRREKHRRGEVVTPRELHDLVPWDDCQGIKDDNDCQGIKDDNICCIKRTPHLVISLDS